MAFLSGLYTLIISPLELLFEVIFSIANRVTGNAGVSIIVLSIVVNFLVLPLYKRADQLQAEERDIQSKMAYRIKRIKKTFKGDERFLMLQEYYRINNYKPIYALKSSASLLLQIPFFIAAYRLLSGMQILQGFSFGFISDLGKEDASFMVGSFPVNVLPILMTLINVISGIIYTKGHPLKEKIQVYGLALVFLVLLYHSPAGLVFYWLLNNTFSLVKNAIGHLRKPKTKEESKKKKLVYDKGGYALVLLSSASLALLTGVLIPSDVVVKNPAEMINNFISDPHSPVSYIVISALMAAGVFLIWLQVFLYLLKTGKKTMCALSGIAVVSVVNYVAFNKNFGFITSKLIYENVVSFELTEILINIAVDILILAIIIFIAYKWSRVVKILMAGAVLVIACLSIINITVISERIANEDYKYSNTAEEVAIPLSTTGKNVVVIMLDKMNGSYVPYLFNERPDLVSKFDGFTYYPNTVSFGKYTNIASPALYGGYDYTPDRINARSNEALVDKHNESLLTMPLIFSENGWNVSVVDPSYANYQWKPDLSIYDQYEGINAYHMSGVFNFKEPLLVEGGEDLEHRLNRNFFCYGVMKALPYALQKYVYDGGDYFQSGSEETIFLGNASGIHAQVGINELHIKEHAALDSLSDVTREAQDGKNCFFIISNKSTHDLFLLKEPDYAPVSSVDNTAYDASHMERFTVNGVTMNMDSDFCCYAAYECSMESLISLAKWFDYLRENNMYDNTRIIIVSDHGYGMKQFEDFLISDPEFDAEAVNPVLMVKDFNSTGFTTSMDFMTNADTPTLAFKGVVDNPVSPFTNNPIFQDVKSKRVLIYTSDLANVNDNNGTQFVDPEAFWIVAGNNIYDKKNWSVYTGKDI